MGNDFKGDRFACRKERRQFYCAEQMRVVMADLDIGSVLWGFIVAYFGDEKKGFAILALGMRRSK